MKCYITKTSLQVLATLAAGASLLGGLQLQAQTPTLVFTKHSVIKNCRCQTREHKRRSVEFGRDQS